MTAAPASFRDPAGRVVAWRGRILRALNAGGEEAIRSALASPALRAYASAGSIVATRFLGSADIAGLQAVPELRDAMDGTQAVAEHEPAPFANYPHEWAPEMLHAAGALTLDL